MLTLESNPQNKNKLKKKKAWLYRGKKMKINVSIHRFANRKNFTN